MSTRAEIQKLLDAVKDWKRLFDDLTEFAAKRARGLPTTKEPRDFAADAIAHVHRPDHVWDLEKEPSLERHLQSIVNSLLATDVRNAVKRRTWTTAPDAPALADRAEDEPSPENLVRHREMAGKVGEMLRQALAEDALALAVLDGMMEADYEPSALAARLGKPVGEIYKAKRRVNTQLDNARFRFGVEGRLAGAVPDAVARAHALARPRPRPASRWTWAWLAAYAASASALGVGLAAHEARGSFALVVFAVLAYALSLLFALLWVHAAWTLVPESVRFDHEGAALSPAKAALLLLVPVYGVYWMFRVHALVVEGVERAAKVQKSPARASRRLAMAACAAQLVPVVSLVVAPVLWLLHMRRCDRAFGEIPG